jgi:hypothetical protein
MPYIVTVCKSCDMLTDAPEHGLEDEYCEAPDGFERIELFTEREVARRLRDARGNDEDPETRREIEELKAERQSPQGEDHEADPHGPVERGAAALCSFVFPGYVVPREEMARAVLEAANDHGVEWLTRLPKKQIAVGEGPSRGGTVAVEDGAALIAAERQRQIDRERWTPEHDDLHDDGELLRAALCYATPSGLRDPIGKGRLPRSWPWEADAWKPTPDDRVRELVKAGALIAAEIDRLQRSVDKGAS